METGVSVAPSCSRCQQTALSGFYLPSSCGGGACRPGVPVGGQQQKSAIGVLSAALPPLPHLSLHQLATLVDDLGSSFILLLPFL